MPSPDKEKLLASTALIVIALGGVYWVGMATTMEKNQANTPEPGITIIYDQPEWLPPVSEPRNEGAVVPQAATTYTNTQETTPDFGQLRKIIYEALTAKNNGSVFQIVDTTGELLTVEKIHNLRYIVVEGDRAGDQVLMRNIIEVK